MKQLILLLLSFLLLTSFNMEESAVQFYNGSFAEMQAKSKLTKKPYLIDFYTVWCGPCKNMEKYTFTNKELARYLKENYYSFKTDAESLMGDGIELAQKYDVRFFPTLLICSPEGVVLKRLTGFQSADNLLAELKKYENSNPAPEPPTQIKKQEAIANAPTPIPTVSAGEGLFKMSISRQSGAGFGVQIGVFGDYANVIKEAQKLDEDYHRNILVNISKSGDKTVFKMILGPFSSKDQAENYLRELKTNKGRDGMVVDLGKTVGTPPSLAATESRGLNQRVKR